MQSITATAKSQPAIESLQGVVERITFHSEESGYTVARLKAPRMSDLVTIVGNFAAIDTEEQEVEAEFGDRTVVYDYADLDEITLAFATTIHKFQGSEYPVVIVPVFTQHYVMLSRNLIYTGVTRARKLLILVGGQKAISMTELGSLRGGTSP